MNIVLSEEQKALLREWSAHLNKHSFDVKFDGSWDDGTIDSACFTEPNISDDFRKSLTALGAEIDIFCSDLLANSYGNWYDSFAGAYGTILFDFTNGTVSIDLNERVEETRAYSFEGTFKRPRGRPRKNPVETPGEPSG